MNAALNVLREPSSFRAEKDERRRDQSLFGMRYVFYFSGMLWKQHECLFRTYDDLRCPANDKLVG